jgi:hypothetical protein
MVSGLTEKDFTTVDIIKSLVPSLMVGLGGGYGFALLGDLLFSVPDSALFGAMTTVGIFACGASARFLWKYYFGPTASTATDTAGSTDESERPTTEDDHTGGEADSASQGGSGS